MSQKGEFDVKAIVLVTNAVDISKDYCTWEQCELQAVLHDMIDQSTQYAVSKLLGRNSI